MCSICAKLRTAKDIAVLLKPKHYTSILRYDEKISTVYLRLESTPDYSSRKIHPPEFGLKWLGQASSDPVFLKDQRNLGRLSSSEQWFCTLPAKSCPIWTRYGKDYKFGVRASSSLRPENHSFRALAQLSKAGPPAETYPNPFGR